MGHGRPAAEALPSCQVEDRNDYATRHGAVGRSFACAREPRSAHAAPTFDRPRALEGEPHATSPHDRRHAARPAPRPGERRHAFAQAEDWAAIEAAAQQEGKLMVYSTTSRTATAATAFQALTGIEVEVVRLGEQDLIQRAFQEARAGVNSVDMIVVEDWVAARELLAATGYFVNYVPPTAQRAVRPAPPGPAGAGLHQPHLRLQHRQAPRPRPLRERVGPHHARVPRPRDDPRRRASPASTRTPSPSGSAAPTSSRPPTSAASASRWS
jgi:hypothetical protein